MKRLGAFAVALLLTACGGGGPSSPSSSAPAAPPSVTTLDIVSTNTGISYPISVYVPSGTSSGQRLPVLYALDAETRFDGLRGVIEEKRLNLILVGIANTGAARRQVDFLMPGALPYYRFIVDELAPLIESRYPASADPAQRMLSGHSSSALFAGYAFFMESPTNHRFNVFISADGSFWQQPPEVTQAEATMFMANAGRNVPLTLLLGADAMGNVTSVRPLYDTVLARNYSGLRLVEREYNAGHVGMDLPFFRDSLQILLGV